jgi:hypothetical protein
MGYPFLTIKYLMYNVDPVPIGDAPFEIWCHCHPISEILPQTQPEDNLNLTEFCQ